MPPRDAEAVSSSNLRKLKPLAKLPANAVQQTLTPGELRLLKHVLSESIEFVGHPLLQGPEGDNLLLRPLPAARNDDSGVYGLDGAGEIITNLERETFLFLRFNYCRKQLFGVLEGFAGRRLTADGVREVLRWYGAVVEVRGEIVRENLPLVLAMAKRTRITGVDVTDLISEGNLALMRAVDKFDSARGYRFSTYACRAILKSFSRVASRAARHRLRFPTEFDPALERSDLMERSRIATENDCVQELRAILQHNDALLSEVERTVILARFALDSDADTRKAKTLEQVGSMIGVTKERVRQIQNKALGKLRLALEQAAFA